MRKSYRCIIFAMAVWSSLAGAVTSGQDARGNRAAESQSVAKSLERLALSAEKVAETDETVQPCREGDDNRNSDLCAQWKAADAAARSSQLASATNDLSFWALIVGLISSIIAVIAAYFTMRAAKASESALVSFERTEDAQIYISIPEIVLSQQAGKYLIRYKISNIGRTAAIVHTVKFGKQKEQHNQALMPATEDIGRQSQPEYLLNDGVIDFIDIEIEYTSTLSGRWRFDARAVVVDYPGGQSKFGSIESQAIKRIATE